MCIFSLCALIFSCFITFTVYSINMSADQTSQVISGFSVKFAANSATATQRKAGTIVVRLTAEDAKRFLVSGDANSREFKMKLPLKLKLSNDPNNQQGKIKARLVMADQPEKKEDSRHEKLQNIESKHSSQQKLEELEVPLPSLIPQTSQGGQLNALLPIEETGDLFLQTSPSEIIDLPFSTVCDFFLQIHEELSTKQIYSVLLDHKLIETMLVERTRSHLNFQQTQQLLSIVFEYLALSKNQSQNSTNTLPTRLELRNFAEQLGGEWKRLKEEVFLSNKNILKILDYIQPKCDEEGSRYTHCYFNLKFDLNDDELARVTEAVKYQCRYNHKAFCFLTNYLFTSCQRMEQNNNACIKEIEDTLVAVISKLIKDNPSSNSLQGDDSLLLKHPSFRLNRSQYPAKTLNLRNVPRDKKIELLEAFIQLRARDAQRNSAAFSCLIKDVCSRSGSNLTTGVKIKSMRKRRAIQRVKEKVLDGISLRHRAQLLLDVNPNLSIDEYTDLEFQQYKQRLNAIFLSLQESIEFGVDDLLRGRCIFASIDALNNCCEQLKAEITKRGYLLLSVLNRLREKSCDVVLHIRMGETIAELQLVLNYKLVQNQFSSKLHHLRRAVFYNHLTHLKLYNEKLTYLFLQQALTFVHDNNTSHCSHVDYREKTNYPNTKLNLQRFIEQLPFKIDKAQAEGGQLELPMLAAEVAKFKTICNHPTSGRIAPSPHQEKNNADFLYQLGNYDQSLEQDLHYCKAVEEKHRQLIEHAQIKIFTPEERELLKNYAGAVYVIGKIHMRRKNYIQAVERLEYSERLTKVLGNRDEYVVETLQHLGEIEYRRGNFNRSIEIYQNLLKFQQTSAKQSPEQYSQTLMALALVYQHQGSYFESEKHFQRLLCLLQKEKGKEHIQLANVYNHLGATYNLEGSLASSLAAYKQSLSIIEKEKGRNSIDCASVLANVALIYQNDANYYEAIRHYEQAVKICLKHNLKESTYANSAFGLGKCYSALKNYTKAIEYYEKALEYYAKQKGQIYYATLTDIAVAYEGLGDDEKANQYYDRLQAH